MPKITYIKNVDNEIIYPKTHEDAILTEDGYSISEKIQIIKKELSNKSNNGHNHDFSSLLNIPNGFKANGGNSDTVCNKNVNDGIISINSLWTSKKINDEISKINNIAESKSNISIGNIEPKDSNLWVDTDEKILKYKLNDKWEIAESDIKIKIKEDEE